MTDEMESQITWSDLGLWSGKTSPELSAATEAKTSRQSSRRSSASQSRTLPMCLCLTRGGGLNADTSTMTWADGALPGGRWTLNTGERPSEENASLLSQILEETAQEKYYLSARACEGILNRAERRGKELPKELKIALENQALTAYKGGLTSKGRQGEGISNELSYSLNTVDQHGVNDIDRHGVMAFKPRNGAKIRGIGFKREKAPTITADENFALACDVYNQTVDTIAPTVTAAVGGGKHKRSESDR